MQYLHQVGTGVVVQGHDRLLSADVKKALGVKLNSKAEVQV